MRRWPESLPALPPLPTVRRSAREETFTVRLATLTPMVGGGACQGVVDALAPVHPQAIRGHLRFWWRATCGAQYAERNDLFNLFKAESRIWGAQDHAGRVRLAVRDVRTVAGPEPLPRDRYWSEKVGPVLRGLVEKGGFGGGTGWARVRPGGRPEPSPLAYICFPFGSQRPSGLGDATAAMVAFTLDLTYELRDDADMIRNAVRSALWAWVHFGGIGSRTRRGMGALYCPDWVPEVADARNEVPPWLHGELRELGVDLPEAWGEPAWPVLSNLVLAGSPVDVFAAWENAVRVMRDFRQGPELGRTRARGRSRWPEADTIRAWTGCALERHKQRIVEMDGFPRARFGLPIIFHFKNDPGAGRSGGFREREPGDATLTPAGGERWPSPVILRPLAVRARGQLRAVPILALLNTPVPERWELELPCDPEGRPKVRRTLTREDVVAARFAEYKDAPLAGRSPEGDSLKGFVAYVRDQWSSGEGRL
ncbi:MAG: type III-B CRISPR module RAMP protein Cmr1 [Alicyclobacillaceae bacterium]|nr:type III-B CRISPR module RAMP protein Cmr1 [Alicyclobacillaceae bacterium]